MVEYENPVEDSLETKVNPKWAGVEDLTRKELMIKSIKPNVINVGATATYVLAYAIPKLVEVTGLERIYESSNSAWLSLVGVTSVGVYFAESLIAAYMHYKNTTGFNGALRSDIKAHSEGKSTRNLSKSIKSIGKQIRKKDKNLFKHYVRAVLAAETLADKQSVASKAKFIIDTYPSPMESVEKYLIGVSNMSEAEIADGKHVDLVNKLIHDVEEVDVWNSPVEEAFV